jgi:aspartate/tyrosine/aromatic aminotransferase
MQTVSGTGALRIGFQLMKNFYPEMRSKVYFPNPTWSLHYNIIKDAGFEVDHFRYYNAKTKGIDMAGMLEDLELMEDS